VAYVLTIANKVLAGDRSSLPAGMTGSAVNVHTVASAAGDVRIGY
jgi:hypothetical protein